MTEMIKLRRTVTHLQAGLPIFTYCMSMIIISKRTGMILFNLMLKRSIKQKICYTLFTLMAVVLYNTPLLVATYSVSSQFEAPEDVDQNLYDSGLLVKEDPEIDVWWTKQNVPMKICALFVTIISI
jgi:hypothetical protein